MRKLLKNFNRDTYLGLNGRTISNELITLKKGVELWHGARLFSYPSSDILLIVHLKETVNTKLPNE